MSRSVVETILGALVLLVAIGFVAYAYTTSDVADPGGYRLTAEFDRIDGLTVGSPVKISGIKVGEVLSQRLDPQTYQAVLTFSVASEVELPTDSSASVVSESLLGGRYLDLQPGAEIDLLGDGGEITFTQSSINLEDLIGRFVFSGDEGA